MISEKNFHFWYETDTLPEDYLEELQRMPATLSESLEALDRDDVFTELIGEKLLTAIKAVRNVCFSFFLDKKKLCVGFRCFWMNKSI